VIVSRKIRRLTTIVNPIFQRRKLPRRISNRKLLVIISRESQGGCMFRVGVSIDGDGAEANPGDDFKVPRARLRWRRY
jgi:hypothetical protein